MTTVGSLIYSTTNAKGCVGYSHAVPFSFSHRGNRRQGRDVASGRLVFAVVDPCRGWFVPGVPLGDVAVCRHRLVLEPCRPARVRDAIFQVFSKESKWFPLNR